MGDCGGTWRYKEGYGVNNYITNEELENAKQDIIQLLAKKEFTSGRAIFVLNETIKHIKNHSILSI